MTVDTVKVKIDSDELYPFYGLWDYGDEFDVPAEVVERWRSVMAAFKEVQEEMGRYYEGRSDA